MQTNPLLPTPEKTSLRSVLLVPIVALTLLAAASYLGMKLVLPHDARKLIFHQTNDGWQQLPSAGGYPEMLRVSSRGTVWLRTWGKDGLNRWDGTAWQRYKETDLGPKNSYTDSNFVLDGEEVWAPTETGVQHWDGKRWQSYREVPVSRGASIVAAGGQVWVIDSSGNFSHFEGGRWRSHKLVAPGLNWTEDQNGWRSPQLARTPDGALWLAYDGIWRFDGANWEQVTAGTDDLKDAYLVGAAGNLLWLSDQDGLRSVSMDGRNWTFYPPAQTGLAQEAHDVASAGGRTWFASGTGLVEFDGTHWRSLPLPVPGVAGIQRVAAGLDGALWVIGSPPQRSRRAMQYGAYFSILMLLGVVAASIWIFRRLGRRRLQQHQRVTQAVQHATGEVPVELEQAEQRMVQSSSWWATAALYIGAFAGYVIISHVWPKARMWQIPVIVVAIHLANTLRESLVKRRPKPSDPIGPGETSRYDWEKTWKALAGGLLLLAVYNADWIPALKFLPRYTFWILMAVLIGHSSLMMYLVNRAGRRGDYDGALKIIRWFHFYNTSGTEPLRLSGHYLLLAGRYREAEDSLRRSLASSHASKNYAFALEYLGDAQMEQGRYNEATRSYEAALHAFSWVRRPYRGMAEMLLRQGKNPEQALEYVELILDSAGLAWQERQLNDSAKDDYWGLKAWALARLGRSSEVETAIENALKATNKTSHPDLATTHYRAGMAMQALGNQSSANEHFKQALELDPQGRRGTLAQTELRNGTVWEGVSK